MSIRLTGLASGLDTDSIISQLMSLESAPRTQITNRQTKIQAQQTALNDINGKLSLLQTASQSMRSIATWGDTQSVDSSDTTRATATRTGGAASGGYELEVQALANSAQRTYSWAAPSSDTTLSAGGRSIAIASGATVDDAVSAINGDGQTGVYAVNVSGSLVLSSKATGASSDVVASGSAMTEDATKAKAGGDAKYTIDGTAYTSSTNVATNGIAGVSLTLKAKTTSAVTINVGTPGPSKDAVTASVKSFVTAYNNVIDAIRSRTTEKVVPNATSASDLAKGSLFGDSGLNSVLTSLRDTLQSTAAGTSTSYSQLSQIGISTGKATSTINADSVTGKITFDADAFSAAFDADPASVQKLVGGQTGTSGFAQAVEGVITPQTQADGILAQRVSGTTSQLSDITASLARFDDRLAQRQTLYQKQFTALETALSANQTQQSQLTSLLAQLG